MTDHPENQESGGLRRWAVTGPIAAGKSLFTGLLVERGAAVLDADAIGHQLLSDEQVKEAVRRQFGEGVFTGGAVDRRELGRVVFSDGQALARLNAIVHPAMAARIEEDFAALQGAGPGGAAPLAVLEAAVYFLLPSIAGIDLVICVTAPADLRCGRLVAAGLSRAEALARIAAQDHLEEAWARSDISVINDGDTAKLARAAEMILREHGPK